MHTDKSSPKVSCLLLNWNGLAVTRKCLRSLLKTHYDNFEIIVVDNGSANNEADLLEKEFKKLIKVVRSPKNLGYAAGMNLAISKSKGDYIMILNNDMEFGDDWLSPLVSVLQNNKKIAACQPKIKDLKRKDYFESGGAAGGFMDIFGYPFARGRIFSNVEKDKGQYDKVIRISWAGVLLIKKEVLNRIGVFNSIYFNYGEDMDICYRMYGKGYRIVNVPSSVVYHIGGAALKKNMFRKFFFHHRNSIMFLLINLKLSTLSFILLPRFFLDVVSIFYYLINGYRELSFSVIRAYLSLVTLFPQIIRERSKAQKIIRNENLRIFPIYKGSIVWDYFIRKKRIFNHIVSQEDFYELSI